MNKLLVKTSGLNLCEDNSVKTLLFLHGWGMNSKAWEPIRLALESSYHLLWVDLPGHGFNQQLEARSFEEMTDLLVDIIPNNTHLIGWSLGGMIAQAVAQKIPHKISSLTLVTSTPRFSQGENGDWQHAMSDAVLNRFSDNLKHDTEKTLKGFIALQFIGVKDAKHAQGQLINQILYNGKTAKKWGGVILDDDLSFKSNIPTQTALDLGLSILQQVDLRDHAATCPEHWIFAEYDRLIPKQVINDLISLRPDAEITLLERAGHAPFITHPELFVTEITDFIEALS